MKHVSAENTGQIWGSHCREEAETGLLGHNAAKLSSEDGDSMFLQKSVIT
jgi:hypothetical protein